MKKDAYTGPLSPEYALLGLLSQAPAHGYELHQRLASELGQVWHISLSQTYNILNRLEAQGFVAGETLSQQKLPPRRRFRLTAPGQERFEAWLCATSACSVRAIRVEFLTRLYFARALRPELAGELIAAQAEVVRQGVARLRRALEETPPTQPFNRLGVDLRIRQLVSILEWLDEARQALLVELETALAAGEEGA